MRIESKLLVVAFILTGLVHLTDHYTIKTVCGAVVSKSEIKERNLSPNMTKVISVDVPGYGVWNQRVSGFQYSESKEGDIFCFRVDQHKFSENVHIFRNLLGIITVFILTFAAIKASKELL
jgi:hypothetical protein